ncbi:MAG: hypothetical protein KAS11_02235 [Candidatus Aenigmarchaeota archaeon]|nr:hypothetical protein [Candidatus Aenigmarchaeota archaeon]
MQIHTVEHICQKLRNRDFDVMQFERYCFDILAKKDGDVLLIKVLMNIDSFSSLQAEDLKKMASVLVASPVLCGFHGRNFNMLPDSVYERFGIPAVNPDTFLSSLDLVMPYILSKKGKNTVSIDNILLKDMRDESGMSFRKMANVLGLSKKTVYLAEKTGKTSLDVASVIESFFSRDIRLPVDIFSFDISFKVHKKTEFEESVTKLTSRIGYSDLVFHTAPASIIFKDDDAFLMCDIGGSSVNARKVENLKNLGDFCEVPRFVIVNRSNVLNVGGVAVVKIEEIKKTGSKDEFMELICDRE